MADPAKNLEKNQPPNQNQNPPAKKNQPKKPSNTRHMFFFPTQNTKSGFQIDLFFSQNE